MPESVDRLLGVADREQVPARDRLDQLELDDVRVLELVDHHVGKPGAVALPQPRLPGEELPGQQLEILEIDA